MHFWELLGRALYWLTLPLIVVYARFSKPRTRVLLLHDGKVLVVKNWLGSGGWSLPGGGMHADELPNNAAIREVNEELGVVLRASDLIELGGHVSKESKLLRSKYFLFAAKLEQEPKISLQKLEIMDSAWVGLAEVKTASGRFSATVRDSLTTWNKTQNLL